MEPLARSAPSGAAAAPSSSARLSRRGLLKAGAGLAAFSGLHWLTPVAHALALQSERSREPAQSVILLWMAGGPSQLETFDPHPGTKIGGQTRAIETAVRGVKIAEGLPRVAEQMESISLIRSVVTKEGDHERGTYLVKTGYSPDPTAVHPSIGAICCHELPAELPSGLKTEIPRHVSILPNQWPGRGGDLGDIYDAFKTYDPAQKVPDVTPRVPEQRFNRRLSDLEIVESAFARRRRQVARTLHRETVDRARVMMSSQQLKAFDVKQEPAELLALYGDTPFGRGCLAARRLIEVGVRCVEVTLNGWDTHANNHEGCKTQNAVLDPALAALIHDLRQRDLLGRTVVMWGGEFGRTPRINGVGGRDHWPGGFSVALAGGGIRGGMTLGATSPEGDPLKPGDPDTHGIEDVHATIYRTLGIDHAKGYISRAQRPIQFSKGTPIAELL